MRSNSSLTELHDRYNEGTLLHGIIYLQRINDVRMGGVSTRTLRMLRKLCGSDSLKNMRIVSNFWSKEITPEELNRELQMQTDERFFKLFLDDRAQMVRHDNTVQSAHNIIRGICTNAPSALDIQLETVEQRKTLPATSAGIALHTELLGPAQGLQVFVDALQERIKTARAEGNQAKAAELRTEIWEMVPGLARLYNELKNLQALTDNKVDVTHVWNGMDSKAKIVAVFRRSCGMENNPELNDFWAALGDTISFFRGLLAFFEEYPLPLSVHDQLLNDKAVLTPDANEKFDKWFLDNHKEIKKIEGKVDHLVAFKAGEGHESSDLPTKPFKKESALAKVGTRIMNRLTGKRSSLKHRRRELKV